VLETLKQSILFCSPDAAANENMVKSVNTLNFLFFNDLLTFNFYVTFDDVINRMLFILMSY